MRQRNEPRQRAGRAAEEGEDEQRGEREGAREARRHAVHATGELGAGIPWKRWAPQLNFGMRLR
jgi:hypothetical protein